MSTYARCVEVSEACIHSSHVENLKHVRTQGAFMVRYEPGYEFRRNWKLFPLGKRLEKPGRGGFLTNEAIRMVKRF